MLCHCEINAQHYTEETDMLIVVNKGSFGWLRVMVCATIAGNIGKNESCKVPQYTFQFIHFQNHYNKNNSR